MRVTAVSVTLEKRVNDGDYGGERAEAHLAADLEQGDDPVLVLSCLLDEARLRIEADLRKSINREVRKRMNPPLRLCDECGDPLDDFDQYLHKGCDEVQKERRKREREESERAWREKQVAELNGTTPPDARAVGGGNGGRAPAAVFQSTAAGADADDEDLPL